MKFSRSILCLAFSLLQLHVVVVGQHANTNSFQAGAASINITPSLPVPMSGYASRVDPSKAVHDEIFASSFVVSDGKTKACIIQADVIGFSFEFANEVAAEISKKTSIPKENVFLIAVHNHGGPSTGVYEEPKTDNHKAYIAELKKKLVDVAAEANGRIVAARIGIAKGKCTMNINRRARHSEGGIWLGRNPDGPCDHDVDVIKIDNINNEPLGILANWPCHAVVGGWENYNITGDWPGAAARYVKAKFNSIPVLITAGASGDINPIYGPGNSFEEVNAIGLVLGEEIVKQTSNVRTINNNVVTVRNREVSVAGKERNETRMPDQKIVPASPVKLRLSVLKIGQIVFTTISGELMTPIGMKIKEQSPFSNTIVVTHCNGSSGYLCTDQAYKEGGYEPMVSRTAPGVEKIIVDNVLAMLGEL